MPASTKVSAPEAVEVAEVVEAPVAPTNAESHRQSMIDFMAEKFKNEKRVEVKCRHDGDIFVSVNGYSFLIKPNVKVKVPESILPLLEEAGYL
jgi:hypothetical protein